MKIILMACGTYIDENSLWRKAGVNGSETYNYVARGRISAAEIEAPVRR